MRWQRDGPLPKYTALGHHTGWPKSCDTNVAAYCGLINNVMTLILADMCFFSQPVEDINKCEIKPINSWFIFVHFSLFLAFLTISQL